MSGSRNYIFLSRWQEDDLAAQWNQLARRADIRFRKHMLPDHAPNTFLNSEVLWNSVEEVERSRNARLARVIIAALPKELDTKTHVAMVQQYAQEHIDCVCFSPINDVFP